MFPHIVDEDWPNVQHRWAKLNAQKNLEMFGTKFFVMSGPGHGFVHGSVRIRVQIMFRVQKHHHWAKSVLAQNAIL